MGIEPSSLLLLLNWMSPAFPIGSFAYSHGLEQAIDDGRIAREAQTEAWIRDLVTCGSGWNDAVVFSLCWTEPADDVNATALALAGSAERYFETTQLGRSFAIAAGLWCDIAVPEERVAYPVAAGMACKAMGIDRAAAVAAFLQGFCAALVSVAVRLVPLGQMSGLVVLRNLSTVIAETAHRAANATADELGSCCMAAEIAAMKHETLEPRVFRT